MSDRRAVSAGHLAASSVAAAHEPWRVAIGGNRVQNMTVEQIAQAYQAGQLTARTPLWPPGASGWQALGNFEQFQQAAAQPEGAYGQLSQFEEADDAPTRMWTGGGELEELEASLPNAPEPMPSPAIASRPAVRTGTHPVAARPRAVVVATQPSRMNSTASGLASTRAPSTPTRSSGLWLVAGLVGLVGLGSAVLAARGSWSTAAPNPGAPIAVTPSAEIKPSAGEVNQARLAKYEETRGQPSATGAAEAPAAAPAAAPVTAAPAAADAKAPAAPSALVQPSAAPIPTMAEPSGAVPEAKPWASDRRAARNASESSASRAARRERAAARREHAASNEPRASSDSGKLASLAPAAKHEAAPVVEAPKSTLSKAEAKSEAKSENATAVSSAVNDAAATALTSAAKLAASCRPRGGPAGAGKARVIYSPDGEVQTVEILTAKFRDTLTGSCVRMVFRRAKIPPFKGEPPTFIKSFSIPEE